MPCRPSFRSRSCRSNRPSRSPSPCPCRSWPSRCPWWPSRNPSSPSPRPRWCPNRTSPPWCRWR
ncbi:MAG: hypothetical protein D6705_18460 [Deltaproteobacteria bacterium]|nr:MAG: hypothetical protein D6705_18460 [Deltaproteobacteria bacterium]